ncbi:hypothetical protein ABZV93_28030 [Actinopolymorpha sp. NPDC004070]|uniref:hypothetical protein n=1 Tax=Actinopolymorpha sp. NPDC004070 TaxID=3154548 RepID=UPI0033B43AB0
MNATRFCWDGVREPAAYVREVLGREAPEIPEALLNEYPWVQTELSLSDVRPDIGMLERHGRDDVHVRRRDGFVERIRSGVSIPPLILLGRDLKLVDGYARYRALRLLEVDSASVLAQVRDED